MEHCTRPSAEMNIEEVSVRVSSFEWASLRAFTRNLKLKSPIRTYELRDKLGFFETRNSKLAATRARFWPERMRVGMRPQRTFVQPTRASSHP